jgi:hydroxymethylpyrimidine/phosphomethylpyrimidine kinase
MNQKAAVLSVAGFDPTAGAGILVDAAVIRSLGLHPLTVLTSVAAQGSAGVLQIHPLPASLIQREIEIISREFDPQACKIGMLYSPEAVLTTVEFLSQHPLPAVLDPVLKASGGGDLVTSEALDFLEKNLIPRCRIVTPNLIEAAAFLEREIRDRDGAERAALDLHAHWNCAVLIKGGHLAGDPCDVLALDGSTIHYPHERFHGAVTVRGTGCALSTAIAAGLARGYELKTAVESASHYVQEAIRRAYHAGLRDDVRFLELLTEPSSEQSPPSR